MALIKCPECGNETSSMASCCPNCGYPISIPNGKETMLEDAVTGDSSSQNFFIQRQNRKKISGRTAIIVAIATAVVAVCAAGAFYGIHRHRAIARENLQTSDMKMLGVQGPVKSIVYNGNVDPILNLDYISFDEKGFINKMELSPNINAIIKRNSDKLMTESIASDAFGLSVSANYSYNDDYICKVMMSWSTGETMIKAATWDETGRLSELTKNIPIVGFFKLQYPMRYNNVEYIDRFNYIEEDKYGNWTKAEIEETTTYYADKGAASEKVVNKGLITRSIEYYGDPNTANRGIDRPTYSDGLVPAANPNDSPDW